MLQGGVISKFGQDNMFCHVLQPKQVPIIYRSCILELEDIFPQTLL